MSIEHRWMPRQPARLPVLIACRPFGLLRGKLRNISNGGAMVQLGDRLPANTPVELILPVRIDGDRAFRLPAIVTRSSEAGAGLLFGRIESEAWTALLREIKPRLTNDLEVAGDTIRSAPATSG